MEDHFEPSRTAKTTASPAKRILAHCDGLAAAGITVVAAITSMDPGDDWSN